MQPTTWKEYMIPRLFGPDLPPGVAHMAVYGAYAVARSPAALAVQLALKFPGAVDALHQATATLLNAKHQNREIPGPIAYLAALWEFEGQHVLQEALATMPDPLVELLANETPLRPLHWRETTRQRLQRAALDTWTRAQFGDLESVLVN